MFGKPLQVGLCQCLVSSIDISLARASDKVKGTYLRIMHANVRIAHNVVVYSRTKCNVGVAQMVERSLSMREVPGSIPGASKLLNYFDFLNVKRRDNIGPFRM
ncbi:hypothetical protein B5X24_HaOG204259 [Helicoverpa armigera]|nr:hypothetical protein B5X24_HaOG204259 [Helicoverpa armigera]